MMQAFRIRQELHTLQELVLAKKGRPNMSPPQLRYCGGLMRLFGVWAHAHGTPTAYDMFRARL